VATIWTTRRAGYGSRRSFTLGREWKLAYLLSPPVVLVIVGLIAYPLGYAVWLSLQDVKPENKPK
jgi:ABC-type sugar transport system permease subunit